MMTTKDYIGQAYRIDQRINSKLEQVASLRELATKANSTVSHAPRNATRNTHSMEAIIAKIICLEDEINADIDSLVYIKRDIVSLIKAIDNPEYQTLLELRYLCFRSWEHVAVEMGYSASHIKRLHADAIKKIPFSQKMIRNGLE